MSGSGVRRTAVAGAAGVAAAIVLAVGVAWACSPQAYIRANPTSGAAGTKVKVFGDSFNLGPVELRWGSRTGTLLATPSGPSFSVVVTVPDVQPGPYTILALKDGFVAPAGFRVTASTSPSGTPAPGDDGTQSGTQDNGAQSGTQSGTQDNGAQSGTESGTSTERESQPANFGADPAPTSSNGPTSHATADGGAGPATGAPTAGGQTADSRSGTAPDRATERAPAASRVTTAAPTGALQRAESVAPGAPDQTASRPAQLARSAAGDLWSGFAAGRPLSPGGAGLIDAPAGDGAGSELAVGLGLVGVGVASLLGGVLLGELRRRRVPVSAGSRS